MSSVAPAGYVSRSRGHREVTARLLTSSSTATRAGCQAPYVPSGERHSGRPTVAAVPGMPDAKIFVTEDGDRRKEPCAAVPQLTSAIDERKQ